MNFSTCRFVIAFLVSINAHILLAMPPYWSEWCSLSSAVDKGDGSGGDLCRATASLICSVSWKRWSWSLCFSTLHGTRRWHSKLVRLALLWKVPKCHPSSQATSLLWHIHAIVTALLCFLWELTPGYSADEASLALLSYSLSFWSAVLELCVDFFFSDSLVQTKTLENRVPGRHEV